MKADDLLKMTFDEVLEMGDVKGRLAITIWEDAKYLKELERVYFETRNGKTILEAVFICSLNDFELPEWLQKAFRIAYRKVAHFKAGSWDEVFGRPYSKGTHLSTKRENREKSYAVYRRISEIIRTEPEIPVDKNFFERVGKEFGIGGATKTSEIYYEIKKKYLK
jgi:hypothetical protein